MIEVINKCFPQQVKEWEPKLKEMIPSYGIKLVENPELLEEVHASTAQILGLNKN
ncbi:malate:quinone oxidoreductase [Lysinibacillus sphaericus]|uniref:malate:quinone oxidoreductase n=1 Tax=Lysinibacillus sphaericus TaxID=1421 RepID=UPI003F7AA2D6